MHKKNQGIVEEEKVSDTQEFFNALVEFGQEKNEMKEKFLRCRNRNVKSISISRVTTVLLRCQISLYKQVPEADKLME